MSITGWETKPLVVLLLGWLGEESLDSLSNLEKNWKRFLMSQTSREKAWQLSQALAHLAETTTFTNDTQLLARKLRCGGHDHDCNGDDDDHDDF